MKKKRFIWVLVVVVVALVLVGGFYLRKRGTKNETAASMPPVGLNTTISRIGDIATYISSSGTLEPTNNITVTAEINGDITSLLVKKNDVVKKGDLLLTLSNEQAELDYLIAKKEYEASLIDGDELIIKQKLLQLTNAEKALKKTEIRAPIDGTVIEVFVEDIDHVSNGTSIVQIVDLSNFKISLRINELDISEVKEDQSVKVTIPSLGNRSYPAVISSVGVLPIGQGDPVTYPVEVQLVVSDPNLRPGMNCSVDITTEHMANVVIVPVESVNRLGPRSFVTVVSGEETEVVEVELGLSDGLNVAVLSGLEPNTVILRSNYAAYIEAIGPELSQVQSSPAQPQMRGAPTMMTPGISVRPIGGGRF